MNLECVWCRNRYRTILYELMIREIQVICKKCSSSIKLQELDRESYYHEDSDTLLIGVTNKTLRVCPYSFLPNQRNIRQEIKRYPDELVSTLRKVYWDITRIYRVYSIDDMIIPCPQDYFLYLNPNDEYGKDNGYDIPILRNLSFKLEPFVDKMNKLIDIRDQLVVDYKGALSIPSVSEGRLSLCGE